MACVTIFCEVCEVDAAIITRTVNLEDEYYDVIISEIKPIVATPVGAVHTTGVVETHDTASESAETTKARATVPLALLVAVAPTLNH
ncbi:uncharacterized protein CYBJADRAFT_187285 [Cyberlindnera jadinii NRRL Y-1542]|uniref:Uncharacterized protein n=1 Tax=Cyberlindnera jadinii (strain ATCC 18201 / CBS 1600 / BCRC 20928 / JCM 3617 / NBRC 0987 / NRRL Y-1542) TaxID=983966 RepID=A0A1E4RUB3_CYBJN|nr:hypothetical protein CYBJADRAFT_187285 [Cyberlindnera jadinii NRRL Y-1542]ODV70791.1 hypothetical protein CYBJADRAFT_187285 [Cyberlindnera jadinii NRRL Y-1542]